MQKPLIYRQNHLLIEVIMMLVGIVLLLISGYLKITVVELFFRSAGTSLLTASIASYLLIKFSLSNKEQVDCVKIIADSRKTLEGDFYQNIKYNATKIDVIGISLKSALNELAMDESQRMLKNILFKKANLRFMFLSPQASYCEQRAIEDGGKLTDLLKDLKNSLILCKNIYDRALDLYNDAKKKNGLLNTSNFGGLEIRASTMCPHFTIYRADELIYWGIYTSADLGSESAVMQVNHHQEGLFNQLCQHFEALWRWSNEGYIIKLRQCKPPEFNQVIYDDLLSSVNIRLDNMLLQNSNSHNENNISSSSKSI